MDKHQCIARLDKLELEKLDIIRSAEGLSRSGMIRRLIRDFDLDTDDANAGSKFIVDGQISKNIFMQLPIREIRIEAEIDSDSGEILIFINDCADKSVDVLGFVNCPLLVKASMREFYQHDILYWFNSRLYRSINLSWDIGEPLPTSKSNREYYDKTLAVFRATESHLQQIFVV